jgi:[acyl-carrier-protein] S-malonyltransferase
MDMEYLAIVFPGQGSQYVGMGEELYDNFKVVRETFEEASDAIKINLKRLCFEGPEDNLKLTENTQPAILTVSIAIFRVLKGEMELNPHVTAGHSLGEYASLVISGSMAFSDAVRVVKKRGQFMQEAVPEGEGAMAALIGGSKDIVEELCKSAPPGRVVSPANYNSPEQIVISGHRDAVEDVMERAREKGIKRAILLPVSAPFHCCLMEPAGERLAQVLEEVEFKDIEVPVISNVNADLYPSKYDIKRLLREQVSKPVLWYESMLKALSMGVDTFLELGPGKVLTGLMRRIAPEANLFQVENLSTLKATLKAF